MQRENIPERRVIPAEIIMQAMMLTPCSGEVLQMNVGEWLIPFDRNSDCINDMVKPQLDEIVRAIIWLYKKVEIEIRGSAGEGNACDPLLSFRRVMAIKNYLVEKDVPASQVIVRGFI